MYLIINMSYRSENDVIYLRTSKGQEELSVKKISIKIYKSFWLY